MECHSGQRDPPGVAAVIAARGNPGDVGWHSSLRPGLLRRGRLRNGRALRADKQAAPEQQQ